MNTPPPTAAPETRVALQLIALVGNPNSGKTTLFNALTGLRQKVANYPGVTVERKEGRLRCDGQQDAVLLDLPGTYSLNPGSPDEAVATDILSGTADHTPLPDVVICVVDATHIERNLYLVSQIIDRHLPVVVALTMMDIADSTGMSLDVPALGRELGIPVIPVVASRGEGIAELKRAILTTRTASTRTHAWRLPEPVEKETEELAGILQQVHRLPGPRAFEEAIGLLTMESASLDRIDCYAPHVLAHVRKDHQKLDFLGYDRRSVFVESRYAWIKGVTSRVVVQGTGVHSLSDRLDAVLTHRVWGAVVFLVVMGFLFQAMFSWAALPMEWIGAGFAWLGRLVTASMPAGELRDLVVKGGIAGVAAVVTFLPQILLLFLLLGILEDTGYMARAAFIMDRLMSRVGLHGKSFIPLLSSFACAIPGIMAARTIDNSRDRLATMLVAPLMSCSARLPVYALMIAACIPATSVLTVLSLPGLTMLSMYLLGLCMALGMAWIFKKTLLRGVRTPLIIELPPYKMPALRSILMVMLERSWSFLKRAGTVILGASILLWFLGTYPKTDAADPSVQLRNSYVGRAGRMIEPVIAPLGFDWKIGVGLIASLVQREVFVSTMGTMVTMQSGDDPGLTLPERLKGEKNAETGLPVWTALTGICVMVYYVLAMQCISTVAVMRRETNGWKWPLFQIGYMTALAYGVTWVVYHVGLSLGMGGS